MKYDSFKVSKPSIQLNSKTNLAKYFHTISEANNQLNSLRSTLIIQDAAKRKSMLLTTANDSSFTGSYHRVEVAHLPTWLLTKHTRQFVQSEFPFTRQK